MPKVALITGITGQDGSYLAELLLKKGYEVHGIVRRASLINTHRIDHIYEKIKLHYGDLTDSTNLVRVIQKVKPNEIYNLGAQSHVKVSFEMPEYTGMVDGLGTLRILEAVRLLEREKETRIYQASTSEMFGKVVEIPQTEKTPFHPRSPYGFAKVYAYWATKNYREAYDMYACSGILFNHESPRRGETFVTRKIVQALDKIARGEQNVLTLGNLNAKRDWGHAKDYVEAMWLMLQQDKPDDYIVASGETHSVREFVILAAAVMGLDIEFDGDGVKTRGLDKKTGRQIVEISHDFYRPSEPDPLVGNASKARQKLDWQPKVGFEQLVTMMAESDLERAKNGQVWY